MAETETAAALDDETTAALTLFNEYVDADRERTRREKKIKQAERAKDQAAAAVRNAKGAEETAAAEAAYRDAQEHFRKVRDGEDVEPKADAAPAEGAPAAEDAPAETEATAEQTPAAEDAPAEDAPAETEATAEDAPAETEAAAEAVVETDRTDDDAEDAAEDPTPADAGEEQ